jgi:conjugal transfer pilus assembly protein TraF
MLDRSEHFSNGWLKTVYEDPYLDHTLIAPVNQRGRHLQLDLQKQKTTETIKQLAKDYGLFFFFSGECGYCHGFAPIVQEFASNYGWEVLAISIDGGKLEGFKKIVSDNGLFRQWQVEILPALFAVNPHTGHVIPIAYGMTSIDEMETRIMKLVGAT